MANLGPLKKESIEAIKGWQEMIDKSQEKPRRRIQITLDEVLEAMFVIVMFMAFLFIVVMVPWLIIQATKPTPDIDTLAKHCIQQNGIFTQFSDGRWSCTFNGSGR